MRNLTWYAWALLLFPAMPAEAQVTRAVMGVTQTEMS